jgi:hypothetical protein
MTVFHDDPLVRSRIIEHPDDWRWTSERRVAKAGGGGQLPGMSTLAEIESAAALCGDADV